MSNMAIIVACAMAARPHQRRPQRKEGSDPYGRMALRTLMAALIAHQASALAPRAHVIYKGEQHELLRVAVLAPLLPARCIYLLPSAAFRCAKLESGGGSSDARNGFVPSSSSGAKVTDDGLRWTSNHP